VRELAATVVNSKRAHGGAAERSERSRNKFELSQRSTVGQMLRSRGVSVFVDSTAITTGFTRKKSLNLYFYIDLYSKVSRIYKQSPEITRT